jgi:hypothetical protein
MLIGSLGPFFLRVVVPAPELAGSDPETQEAATIASRIRQNTKVERRIGEFPSRLLIEDRQLRKLETRSGGVVIWGQAAQYVSSDNLGALSLPESRNFYLEYSFHDKSGWPTAPEFSVYKQLRPIVVLPNKVLYCSAVISIPLRLNPP